MLLSVNTNVRTSMEFAGPGCRRMPIERDTLYRAVTRTETSVTVAV